MASSSVPSSGGGGLAPKYQKFTTSGTFTLPDGYGVAKPLLVTIQVIGGGGGGGGYATWIFNGNGGHRDYFGEGRMISGTYTTNGNYPGGSGGLCATQLYLTSNLTITVGAAGARGVNASITNNENPYGGNFGNTGGGSAISVPPGSTVFGGGSGGTTTASVLQATGGQASGTNTSIGNYGNVRYSYANYNVGNWFVDNNQPANGTGGTPAGTAGATTPLLGTLAGGSASTTPVRGSFGIGGVSSDGVTTTGAEGTGGGAQSVGAPGAVILTWWQ